MTKEGKAKENEVAAEIKIFKIRTEEGKRLTRGRRGNGMCLNGEYGKWKGANKKDICEDRIYDGNTRSSSNHQESTGTDGSRNKEWSCPMSTADAESQRRSESSSKDGIWQKQLMTSSEKKGVSLVEASSGERPFSQEALEETDTGPARMKWTKKEGIWTKHPEWQAEESSTIDPDLFPKIGEESEAKRRMNWTQINGIWTKSPEQDPDISAEFLEHRGIELTPQKMFKRKHL